MKQTNRKKILYVIPLLHQGLPLSVRINISQRTQLIKQLGHEVTTFPYRGVWSLRGWLTLFRHTQQIDILMIRIDGSCIGDMYTFIKLVRPQLRIIWEVHGFPEENAPTERVILRHIIKKYLRMILSLLVDTCTYISDELRQFAKPRLFAKHHVVIPNFISIKSPHFSRQESNLPAALRKKIKHKFVVLWGGSPQFPWQGIDLIGQLSAYIEQIDLEVIFVVIGKNSWYPLKQTRNILRITNLHRPAYRALLNRADVCIALYNKPPQIPFYFFPMKILDYMYYKRPVIASAFPVLSSIITHRSDGFLVQNTVEDITFLIMQLKNNPKLRNSIGQTAHKTVATRFSDHTARQAYKNMLNTVQK